MSSMASGVVATVHSDDARHCVKVIKQPNGTFGFQEYRRDPEDAGGWTLVQENSGASLATERLALAAARSSVAWLSETAASTVKD
jgi:hypothetical protein